MMRIRKLMCIAALFLPAPLLAQSTNGALCGVTADADIFNTLSGNYTLVLGPGILSMMGYTVPFPQSEPFTAKIFENDGNLLLFADPGAFRLHFSTNSSAAPLAQIAPGTDLQAKIDELNAAACPRGNVVLPYLAGEGAWLSDDDVQMDAIFTMVFSASQEGAVHGWGFMQSSGGGANIDARMILDPAE